MAFALLFLVCSSVTYLTGAGPAGERRRPEETYAGIADATATARPVVVSISASPAPTIEPPHTAPFVERTPSPHPESTTHPALAASASLPTPKPTPPPTPRPTPKPTPVPTPTPSAACSRNDASRQICQAWGGTDKDKAVRVADCESGLNPQATSPSGVNLGLWQMTKDTWHAYGGPGDDPRASSAYVQTQVAWRVYQNGGWARWPGCRDS